MKYAISFNAVLNHDDRWYDISVGLNFEKSNNALWKMC